MTMRTTANTVDAPKPRNRKQPGCAASRAFRSLHLEKFIVMCM
jgi:hypothetical protein